MRRCCNRPRFTLVRVESLDGYLATAVCRCRCGAERRPRKCRIERARLYRNYAGAHILTTRIEFRVTKSKLEAILPWLEATAA